MTPAKTTGTTINPGELKPEALPAAQALQQELAKPEPLPALSLHRIETELMQLLEAREQAESEGVPPDELKIFDIEIQRYVSAELKKVDGIAHSIRASLSFADEAKRERERLDAREKAWRARAERIKAATLYAMQTAGVRVLETATNKLRVQPNGGLAPLEVNEGTLSREYRVVRVAMRASDWDAIYPKHNAPPVLVAIAEPDNARIREELGRRIPCPECRPDGKYIIAMLDCPRCKGTGTVPQIIQGARLGERSVHLRVE